MGRSHLGLIAGAIINSSSGQGLARGGSNHGVLMLIVHPQTVSGNYHPRRGERSIYLPQRRVRTTLHFTSRTTHKVAQVGRRAYTVPRVLQPAEITFNQASAPTLPGRPSQEPQRPDVISNNIPKENIRTRPPAHAQPPRESPRPITPQQAVICTRTRAINVTLRYSAALTARSTTGQHQQYGTRCHRTRTHTSYHAPETA